jgi:hypothetical protein
MKDSTPDRCFLLHTEDMVTEFWYLKTASETGVQVVCREDGGDSENHRYE